MGKALVIGDIVVANPLCKVTIVDSAIDAALYQYYAANKSINASEKIALEKFVQGLIDNGIWSKMKYFYPMLGDNVPDMLTNAISPSTDDYLSKVATDYLSVNGRTLHVQSQSQSQTVIFGDRFPKTMNLNDSSMISCCSYAEDVSTGSKSIKLLGDITTPNDVLNRFGLVDRAFSGYGYPCVEVYLNSTNVINVPPSSSEAGNQSAYKNRIICSTYDRASLTLYKEGEEYSKAVYDTDLSSLNASSYRVMYSTIDTDFNFAALGSYLTASEWSVFYSYLLQFLKDVGRHS